MLVTMEQEGSWRDLVAALDAWTAATAVTEGSIEVALPGDGGPGRRVLVMLTPDEWDDMTGPMWGSFEDAVGDVKQTLGEMGAGDGYAVYCHYRLVPSASPTLGSEDGPAAPSGPGEWVVRDSQGRVTSRLADWPDQPAES
jgi:sarcosine oxidase gamma subunit